jgi:hypothetical protein
LLENDKKKRIASANVNYKPSGSEVDGFSKDKIEQLKQIAVMKAVTIDTRRNTSAIFAKSEII